MNKVLLIPDSFKGTMSSEEICSIMSDVIKEEYPNAQVVSIPVADGGEGSVDAFISAMGGEKIYLKVNGPYNEEITSFYGKINDVAVMEMASAAGLPLVGDNKQAEKTTTYGVGQIIAAAAKNGAKKIIVGLGGSSTNDGGTGMAAALGVKFYDKYGNKFIPVGETLSNIDKIAIDNIIPELKGIEIVTMCDIDNPLCGKNGAAKIFGPQKGATPDIVKMLDNGLLHLSEIIKRDIGKDVANIPGAGAAGGMGAGMVAFLSSSLKMGIETVLDAVDFDKLLDNTDMVFTGEGKIDGQSLRGKVVIGVAHRAMVKKVPVIAVVGDIGDDAVDAYKEGVSAIFSINRVAVTYKEAKLRAKNDMKLTMQNILKFYKLVK